jgi:hypothetical protein
MKRKKGNRAQLSRLMESATPGEAPKDTPEDGFKFIFDESVSLEDTQTRVRYAFRGMMQSMPDVGDYEYYPIYVFADFLTCCRKGRTYRATWKEENGEVEIGELEEVEVEFVPIKKPEAPAPAAMPESANAPVEKLPEGVVHFHEKPFTGDGEKEQTIVLGALHEAANDIGGNVWDVTVIKAGRTVERRFTSGTKWVREYPRDVLEESISVFERVPVFAFEGKEHAQSPGAKGPRERVGNIRNVHMSGDDMRAQLVIHDDAVWLKQRLQGLQRESLLDTYGLSIDAGGDGKWKQEPGLAVFVVSKIAEASSVDVVNSPAAGGAFNRLVASQEEEMNLEQLLQMIRDMRPDLLESVDAKTVTMEQAQAILKEALKAPESEAPKPKEPVAPVQESANDAGISQALKEAQALHEEIRTERCATILESRLSESKLPKPIQAKLRGQFKGKIFEAKVLEDAIALERETLSQLVQDLPRAYGGAEVSKDEQDKHIHALEAMMWGSQGRSHENFPEHLKTVTPFRSLHEAYRTVTGNRNASVDLMYSETAAASPQHLAVMAESGRLSESLTNASWPQALGSVMHRRLLAEYALTELNDWRKIVSEISSSHDFRTNYRIRAGGYGTLPTVGEQGTYQNLTSPTDEQESFAVTKKGGLEDYTFEMMKNDDVGALRRIPRALARAAQETLFRGVFDILEDNDTLVSDTTAIIDSTHNNEISGVLAADTLTEGRRLMRNQTAYNNSTEFLRNNPRYLIHPTELWDLAHQLTDRRPYNISGQGEVDDANRNMNVHNTYGLEPIEVDYYAVATDYWLVGDPARVPTVEVSFLDGREEPELFVQDMPNIGSMFNADKITWKIRHIWATVALDYRGFAAYIA